MPDPARGAGLAADPKPPRLPGAPNTAWPDPELDPQYPDVETLDLRDRSIELPEARTLSILRSQLTDCDLALDPSVPIELQDCVLVGIDLTGRRITDMTRVRLERCRLGGADLGDAQVRDTWLDDCVLDLAAWRGARLERVRIAGGRLDGLDLTSAEMTDVVVSDVALTDVTLDRVRAERVDLTAADVSAVRDVASLRGCTLSPAQAVELAARALRALGVNVHLDG